MTSWTTPADVERKLRRRWSSGQALAAYACGEPWEPPGIGLRGPAAGEMASDLDAVRTWVTAT